MRNLSGNEIQALEARGCRAEDWTKVLVDEAFNTAYVSDVTFSGKVLMGRFEKEIPFPGGLSRHSGVRNVILHNVEVGDDCLIENVQGYIANYRIGHDTVIENVNEIYVDGVSDFGNGIGVNVMNETGGREVYISDKLSAQLAYLMALYRYRPELTRRLKQLSDHYTAKHASDCGEIGPNCRIQHSGCIKNVRIGSDCRINGVSRLKNGSINSNTKAPVEIGHNVVCDDFIISSGSHLEDGVMISRCFVGQACQLGHGYSAQDCLFFSNCQGENGEACSIFAGPFTVTHHKSTLLIAAMYSFMNAGSGSNQSNHMYKLGPIHQGTLERGAKTSSDSYILWPSRVGAFSLVIGRHVNHSDTTNLPFSYLIEKSNTTYLVPGVNLKSVGTIRDAQKWPKRDKRHDDNLLDCINYNLLSPYTVQKMFYGVEILKSLVRASGQLTDVYSYQSAKINNQALFKGLEYYDIAIRKFMGNSIIKRLEALQFSSDEDIRKALKPAHGIGSGEWVDLSGLIAPKSQVEQLLSDIETGKLCRLADINAAFQAMHRSYYDFEWTWAYEKIQEFYGIDPEQITARDIKMIVEKWRDAVVGLDRLVYEDAKKEFSLSSMTGFGVDGSKQEKAQDFEQVRGDFESNPFVTEVLSHIQRKSALGDELIGRISHLL